MIPRGIAKRYATALFNAAVDTNAVDEVNNDTAAFRKLLSENPSLREFLLSPQVLMKDKKSVIENTLKGQATDIFVDFLVLLVDKKRFPHVEEIMDGYYVQSDAEEGKGKEAILNSVDTQFSEDDNVLVQGVVGSPYAIGYFGFAYFQENQDQLKSLSIDGVAPSAETAEDNSYPISRPLFIYSDAGVMQSKPQVAAFINYYLTYVNDEIVEVGYFPASSDALDNAKQNWLDAMGQ